MPTLRGSAQLVASGTTATLNLPAGTVAGDTAIIFGGNWFGWIDPSGWTPIGGVSSGGGSPCTANAWTKVLDATDISVGSVSISSGGSGGFYAALAVYVGTVAIRSPGAFEILSGNPSPFTSDTSAMTGDSCLMFATIRDWDDINSSIGTQLQTGGGPTGESGSLYEYVPTADGQFSGNYIMTWHNGARVAIVLDVYDAAPVNSLPTIGQFAIVTVTAEYDIPKVYVPLGIGNFMATMPYYIGEN